MTERDELMSEIEHTREELADTVSELVSKLDVKEQARHRAHEVGEQAAERYREVKASAPQPVQAGLDKAEYAGGRVAAQAKADPKRALLIAGGAVLVLLLVRRLRKS
jgi:hypothetical protein